MEVTCERLRKVSTSIGNPRFSPDGQRILFTRSKKGWVSEQDANRNTKMGYVYYQAGWQRSEARGKKMRAGRLGSIATRFFWARKTKVFRLDLNSGAETLLVDSAQVPALGGADLQNPNMEPAGEHIAITLRGAKRETGIFKLADKSWVQTGHGCQIGWFPKGDRIIWINPSGNGGSQVFSVPVAEGRPSQEFSTDQDALHGYPRSPLSRVLSQTRSAGPMVGLGSNATRATTTTSQTMKSTSGELAHPPIRRRGSPSILATTAGPTSSFQADSGASKPHHAFGLTAPACPVSPHRRRGRLCDRHRFRSHCRSLDGAASGAARRQSGPNRNKAGRRRPPRKPRIVSLCRAGWRAPSSAAAAADPCSPVGAMSVVAVQAAAPLVRRQEGRGGWVEVSAVGWLTCSA